MPNANTWHLKNPNGGIRSESNEILYGQDETIFNNLINYKTYFLIFDYLKIMWIINNILLGRKFFG